MSAPRAVEPRGRRAKILAWFSRHRFSSGVAAVLVAAAAWLFPREAAPPTEVPVPDLVGTTVTEAEQVLREQGLVARRFSGPESQSPGVVVSQNPSAGTHVERGSQVDLEVSVPLSTVAVPRLVGLELQQARERLADLGLELVASGRRESGELPPDHVLEQVPNPGTVVSVGERVTVTISTEPPERARLALVDVDVAAAGRVAEIDLTVRNDGGQVAVITDVELVITGYAASILRGRLPPSATYDAVLPDLNSEPATLPVRVVVPVSQVVDPIGPDAVDRFLVRVSPAGDRPLHHLYTFTVGVTEASSQDEWEEPFSVRLVSSEAPAATPVPGP